jgi:P-type E1-E2 ATPase
VDTFVLDKTGTVTEGKWKLLKIIPTGSFTEEEVLCQAISLEKDSEHYIASELRNRARQANIAPQKDAALEVLDNGIEGYVGEFRVRIGSKGFLGKELERFESLNRSLSLELGSRYSHVFMSTEGKLSAVFVYGDEVKKGSSVAIRNLKAAGHRVLLISGDGNDTTRAVAEEVGIEESYGGQLPQDKVAIVERLKREGHHVAMVGDGINDAPALVQADLGIGVSSGNDLGREAGSITLMRGDLGQILDFMDLGKRVNKKIRQNLLFSGLYNIIAIPIAMSGLLNPLIAVSAMLLSSLTVIGNTVLLIKKSTSSQIPEETLVPSLKKKLSSRPLRHAQGKLRERSFKSHEYQDFSLRSK